MFDIRDFVPYESSNQMFLSSTCYSSDVRGHKVFILALRSCVHKVMLVTRLCSCQPLSHHSGPLSCAVNRKEKSEG